MRPKSVSGNNHSEIWGIDGEAWTVGPDDPVAGREHIYGLLLAANESGHTRRVHNSGKRLSTKQCLDFLLELPEHAFVVAFSFKYDLTKILEDLPDHLLYKLNHSSSKVDEKLGVEWYATDCCTPYTIQYLGSKFVVQHGSRMRVVWDLFKFYQTSFIKTMKLWKVLDNLEEISTMKDRRGEFTIEQLPEIEHYCKLECVNLSHLARKLLNAVTTAGLDLEGKYYGAGSVGGAVLKRMNGEQENVLTKTGVPKEMYDAIIRAFSGGRFETSMGGPCHSPCYEYDISSAYPYQIYKLPCMRHTCGKWELTTDYVKVAAAQVALVHYDLSTPPTVNKGWGPFPYRTAKGTITYPVTSGGGWCWLEEYCAGASLFDNVRFVEAWVWVPNEACHHPNPFHDIALLYIERCKLGKEGAGIIIKLGYNAGYGKMAQSIGKAVFNNWIWAGMVTSGCRAQLLRLMALHKDMSNILMVATDGLYTTEKIDTPKPCDTGTGPDKLFDEHGKSKNAPLGGWEESPLEHGMFIIRPGVYFKLDDNAPDDKKKVKCRGIGLRQMIDARQALIEHYARTQGAEPFEFTLTRFHGMKTATGKKTETSRLFPVDSVKLYYRRPYYGRWKTMKHQLSFSPMPKRALGFAPRALPDPELEGISRPYQKALAMLQDEETMSAILDADSLLEQPDVGDMMI
jgi:hypothetical protein